MSNDDTLYDCDGIEKFRHLEMEICSLCDVNCPMCDRFSDVAVGASMTVRQVERFIAESVELEWPWERIRILGGEPTIHPQFVKIVELLVDYKSKHNPNLFLTVFSNGVGKIDEYRGWLERLGVVIYIAQKDGSIPEYFDNMWVAPIDTVPGEQPPCGIFGIRSCGIGLSAHGYYACGAGASIARVSGQDIAIRKLSDLTYNKAYGQTKTLCNLCGHAVGFSRHQTDGSYTPMTTDRGAYWTKTLAEYKENRIRLEKY